MQSCSVGENAKFICCVFCAKLTQLHICELCLKPSDISSFAVEHGADVMKIDDENKVSNLERPNDWNTGSRRINFSDVG